MNMNQLAKILECSRMSIYKYIKRHGKNAPKIDDINSWIEMKTTNIMSVSQKNKKGKVPIACLACGKLIYQYASAITARAICSKKCRSELRVRRHSSVCVICKKEFIKRSKEKCCSLKCGHIHQGKTVTKNPTLRAHSSLCMVCGLQIFGNGSKTCGAEWCKHYYKNNMQKFDNYRGIRSTPESLKARRIKYQSIARARYATDPRIRAQHRARKHNRKALILKATIGTDAAAGYRAAMKAKNCYWCGCKLTRDNLEVDHIHPLARGGAHAAYNLAASCAFCNRSRQAKLTIECQSIKQPELMFV